MKIYDLELCVCVGYALPSQCFTKSDIDNMFSFDTEMVPPRILHSQSDSNMASEKCAESILSSRSCVESELRHKSSFENTGVNSKTGKMSVPTCTFTATRETVHNAYVDSSEDRNSNTFENGPQLNPQAQAFVSNKIVPRIKELILPCPPSQEIESTGWNSRPFGQLS